MFFKLLLFDAGCRCVYWGCEGVSNFCENMLVFLLTIYVIFCNFVGDFNANGRE